MPSHEPCAGAVVFDDAGRLLLIKRGRPPGAGRWSVPGGRCDAGESPEQACVREMREETGLQIRVLRRAGRVLRDGPAGQVYVIDDFVGMVVGGTLAAASDAVEARWVTAADLAALELVPELQESLAGWDLLPRC